MFSDASNYLSIPYNRTLRHFELASTQTGKISLEKSARYVVKIPPVYDGLVFHDKIDAILTADLDNNQQDFFYHRPFCTIIIRLFTAGRL